MYAYWLMGQPAIYGNNLVAKLAPMISSKDIIIPDCPINIVWHSESNVLHDVRTKRVADFNDAAALLRGNHSRIGIACIRFLVESWNGFKIIPPPRFCLNINGWAFPRIFEMDDIAEGIRLPFRFCKIHFSYGNPRPFTKVTANLHFLKLSLHCGGLLLHYFQLASGDISTLYHLPILQIDQNTHDEAAYNAENLNPVF